MKAAGITTFFQFTERQCLFCNHGQKRMAVLAIILPLNWLLLCLSLEIRYYLTCECSCILCPNFEKFCPNNGQFFSVGDATACPATPCRTFMCNCQCWTRSGFQIAIQSDSAIQNRTGLDWILKKINRIRYGYPKLHWSLQYTASPEFFLDINRIGSNIWTGLPD